MIRTGMTCLAVSLLAGCAAPISLDEPAQRPATPLSTPSEPAPADRGGAQVLPIDPPVAEGPARERLRGALGAEGWQLCGQAQPRPMRVSPEARSALESFLTHNPAFFLDGWGRVAGGEIELESVERMYVEGPGCREPLDSFVWVAHGQEPFWAFAITNAGMQFRAPGAQPRTYAYAEPQTDGDRVVYAGADYRLTLRRQECRGTMANSSYAWTAELQTADRQWRGCAWQGMQVEQPAPAVPPLQNAVPAPAAPASVPR